MDKDWEDAVESRRGGSSDGSQSFKHIFLAIDGTWQAAFSDVFQSNVFRLNIALNFHDETDSENAQIFIYSPGLGTMAETGEIVAGAFGDGFDQSVLLAYMHLVSTYVPGDKIYIFGFSRGAVTARALTGFISYSGLVFANSAAHIGHAWDYFTDKKSKHFNYAQERGKVAHSENIEIEFLGLWDTVSGPYKQEDLVERYRFSDQLLGKNVKHGVHIISIDETRKAFSPLVWTGCSDEENQTLEQIWLPGVHGDIGGGYGDAFLSTISLLTMIDKLAEYYPELSFDEDYIKTLLKTVENEPPVVNNERQRFSKWWSGTKPRKGTEASHASRHPLLSFMRSRNINVRGKRRPYSPPAWVGDGLPETKFTSKSWHSKKLRAILKNIMIDRLGR